MAILISAISQFLSEGKLILNLNVQAISHVIPKNMNLLLHTSDRNLENLKARNSYFI